MKQIDLDSITSQIASLILEEEAGFSKDEKERQDAVSKEIKDDDLDAPAKDEDDKSRLTDEGEEDEEGEEDIEPKPKPGDEEDDEDDGDFEVTAAKKIPRTMTLDDMKDQINNLRAGKSLNNRQG